MRRFSAWICAAFIGFGAMSAQAQDCAPDTLNTSVANTSVLGTSRILPLDPEGGLEIGKQYGRTLPLGHKEVVLTFDDGPLPAYTNRVLDILARECIKATFFLVGRNAAAYPETVRRIARDGHTIGTHSMTHRMDIPKLPFSGGLAEVDNGFAAVRAALGADADTARVAPFFRFPGLLHTRPLRDTLAERHIGIFGIDMEGGDWFHFFTPQAVLDRVMLQLANEQRGVLLLHDIQKRTVDMLPALITRLKAGGYRIVHIVPKGHDGTSNQAAVTSRDLIPSVSWARAQITARRQRKAERVPELAIPVVMPTVSFDGMTLLHPVGDRLGYADLPRPDLSYEGYDAVLPVDFQLIGRKPALQPAPQRAAFLSPPPPEAAPALRLSMDADGQLRVTQD